MMKIFLTGATGFIGSAIVPELIRAGHGVVGLARSEESAQKLVGMGASVQRGALDDLDALRDAAAASDGVIHCGFIHDFTNYRAAIETDLRAVQTMGDALAGSGRPLVNTSGTLYVRPGQLATERDAADPATGAPRAGSEEATLALAERGVRASVVRLSPTVHGEGDHGFVPAIVGMAREKGRSAYIGDGANRWSAVHRLDAARLFRLALEKGEAGSRYHGVAEEGIPFCAIAEAIGKGTGLPVVGLSPEEAKDHFGWMAMFAGIDGPASSALTREGLGWEPTGPTLLQDMVDAGYFAG